MKNSLESHQTLQASLFCLFLGIFLVACSSNTDQSKGNSQNSHQEHSAGNAGLAANPTPRIPAFFANLEDAKPLPKVLDPKQFTTPVVQKAYQYAAENSEFFAQQPCYCNCDTGYQHRSLLDCFATDHSAG
jgi:hypothetical protein